MAFRIVGEFLDRAHHAASEAMLCDLFEASLGKMGCNRFSAWSDDALHGNSMGAISIEQFPPHWLAEVLDRQTWRIDPIPRLGRLTVSPFLWTDPQVEAQFDETERLFMKEAEAAGVSGGLFIPVWSAGSTLGNVSVFADGEPVHSGAVNRLHNLSVVFYEALRRLKTVDEKIEPNELVTTERDCLSWLAHGQDDWEISTLLNISENEVRIHVGQAMRKFGVPTRTQAVVQAIMTGQIVP